MTIQTNKKCIPDTLSGYIYLKKNIYYSFLIGKDGLSAMQTVQWQLPTKS